MNILLVGGDYGDNPRASKIISEIYKALIQISSDNYWDTITCKNGGTLPDLIEIYNSTWKSTQYDVVLWFPNVSNDLDHKYRDIKAHRNDLILVTSKRNNNEYSFQYLINHALHLKSNLFVEFSKVDGQIFTTLYDPLGCCWSEKTNYLPVFAYNLYERINFLFKLKRQVSEQIIDDLPIHISSEPDINKFLSFIRTSGEIFHKLILPDSNVTRFLGNASFRCTKGGFPSVRSKSNNKLIFVSKRNIDKTCIDQNGFVPVLLQTKTDKPLLYFGDYKPSVDTPIQMQLYNKYSWINYMLHSHVYIKDAPFTNVNFPCGSLEEIDEISSIVDVRQYMLFEEDGKIKSPMEFGLSINLIGHGSIILANKLEYFDTIKYIPRPIPEICYKTS